MTLPGLEPTIYRTRGEHAILYATNAVMSIMINMSPEISNKVGQYKLHNTPDRLLLTTVPLVRTTLTKVLIVSFPLISMLSILLYFNCWGRILFMKFNTEFSKLWVDFQIVLCRLDTRHFYKLQITMANSLFPTKGPRVAK